MSDAVAQGMKNKGHDKKGHKEAKAGGNQGNPHDKGATDNKTRLTKLVREPSDGAPLDEDYHQGHQGQDIAGMRGLETKTLQDEKGKDGLQLGKAGGDEKKEEDGDPRGGAP